ncbi:general secretion pathway protein, ATPase [Beggiatoa sp. PS]|nr:general secretion pathway protein, ATPase [Beggiatoa sp. PS]
MYYEHFGLKYPPFKITPDTQLFYSGGNRGLVLNALIYAIENGEGIIKVVGEVGSGKTMLCHKLEERLPKRIEIVYIANPRLPAEMILHAIALEMRLPITKRSNRLQVMHALHQRLLDKHANKQQVVLFVEEAQGMPLDTLEEIRLLSNLETSHHKLLQIVLFGQPELDTHLSVSQIRQLKERITQNFYLSALTRESIREYLQFRMHAVGYRGPPVFSPASVRLITKISKGLIRRVNILADKALLVAFADDVYRVRPKYIKLAARDSNFNYPHFSISIWTSLLMVMALIAGLGLFSVKDYLWTWWHSWAKSDQIVSVNKPKTTVPLSNTSINTTESILQQRIKTTQQWLATVNAQHYTLQVMRTKVDNTKNLITFLSHPEIQPLLNDLYLYQLKDQKEQVFWEVTYGEFANAGSAKATIATLPQILQRNKPFLRKIANLR